MKLKFPILLLFLVMLSASVSAKVVDATTACTVASHFFALKFSHAPESLTPTVAYTAPSLRSNDGSAPSFYVINFESEGFVIVAGDDRVQPILAFSDEGPFVTENIPAHIRFFLDGYTEGVRYIVENQLYSDDGVQQQWGALLSGTAIASKDGDGEVVVNPLLGNNKWDQTMYYNDLCPADATGDPAYGGHAAVGCGALVMGQVMRYWQYPTTGIGSHSYNSSYGTLSANFGETTYHYENMPDKFLYIYHPDSCVEAVATLLYHCGVAVNMNYGPSASVSNSNNIVSALSTYFCYPTTVQYIERESLSSAVWLDYLKCELDEGAPFMYGGSGNYGGHVWVCDGYRDDDYFHFNWGWGGKQNGYYALTNCSVYGFNNNHAIIIGIRGPELPATVAEYRVQNTHAFPNPTNGSVHVCAESQPVLSVQVFDMFGKMLSHKNVGEKEFFVDLSDYDMGIYILRLVSSKGVETIKIVKR
ncbi:MAG: thiol protease/hemagglutinin PrtT [Bacteroidales bacterium]|nr:thiol protease/hemagglutinin PrtT [Bacteroidales bacterium]